MSYTKHYQALKAMYLSAPINEIYPPVIEIKQGWAEVSIDVDPAHFHSAGSLHGSVYFKLLDDSAFFAANSLEDEVFVPTISFSTNILKPVSSGRIRAVGQIDKVEKAKIYASSIMYDDAGDIVARGEGLFFPSKVRLSTIPTYQQQD